jgi:hypothetical protein
MRHNHSRRLALVFLFACCACLAGCGGTSATPNGTPATVAYMWGNDYPTFDDGPAQTILEFSIASPKSTSPLGTLTLPFSCDGGPLATDSLGQLYVACFSPTSAPLVLVYPPNASGSVAPIRTINLSKSYYEIATLTVDANDQLYVGALENSTEDNPPFAVIVYAQEASGSAVPLRTLQLPASDGLLAVAVDGTGNIYVAQYPELYYGSGPVSLVNVYSASATGSAVPLRTIDFSYFIYGLAVDQSGRVFVTAGIGPDNILAAIEEFAPDATGNATPTNTIGLTALPDSPGTSIGGGSVHVDGAGNVFAAFNGGGDASFNSVLYGFGAATAGNVVPIAQSEQNYYNSSFALH